MHPVAVGVRTAIICVALLNVSTSAWAQQLTLIWDPSPDASVTGYYVYAGPAPGVYDKRYDVGNTTSFVFSDGVAGQRYYFAAVAYVSGQIVSLPTNEVSWLIGDIPPSLVDPGSPEATTNEATPPIVTITLPTTSDRFDTSSPYVTLGGSAAGESEVTLVMWVNERGGSGNATGTATWLAAIPLFPGRNDIRVTAVDTAGNRGTANISVFEQ